PRHAAPGRDRGAPRRGDEKARKRSGRGAQSCCGSRRQVWWRRRQAVIKSAGLLAQHRRAGNGAGVMEEFYRIRRLPPYVFEQVNRAKAAARNAGADIIDLGMGNPDLPAPAHVIEKLKETVGKPRTNRYSASRGIAGLRRAQAAYYGRRFGVKLNPETQIVTTLGSKEGFANVAQAITAPGDVIVVPNP